MKIRHHLPAHFLRLWLIALVAALAALASPPLARAEIVTTDEIAATAPADAERAKVQAFQERATVGEKLQALGVDSLTAKERVNAMSQEEVHALAQKIDALPAGGNLSGTDIIIILLAVILLAIII